MARQRIAAAVHLAAHRAEGQHVEGVLLGVLFQGDLGAKIHAVADLTGELGDGDAHNGGKRSSNKRNKNNNRNDRRKFRSQTSDNMDKGGESQRRSEKRREENRREEKRREEKKKEDQKRESFRRKKIQVREKVGKSRNTVFFQ